MFPRFSFPWNLATPFCSHLPIKEAFQPPLEHLMLLIYFSHKGKFRLIVTVVVVDFVARIAHFRSLNGGAVVNLQAASYIIAEDGVRNLWSRGHTKPQHKTHRRCTNRGTTTIIKLKKKREGGGRLERYEGNLRGRKLIRVLFKGGKRPHRGDSVQSLTIPSRSPKQLTSVSRESCTHSFLCLILLSYESSPLFLL